MPGRTPYAATQAFLDPLKSSLGCLGSVHLNISPGGRDQTGKVHVWSIDNFELSNHMLLNASMHYEIVPFNTGERKWRVSTRGYLYGLCARGGQELLSAHWHPVGMSPYTDPHWHIGAAGIGEGGVWPAREHLRSSRISVEQMIRHAISFGANGSDDWEARVDKSEAVFEEFRTWHDTPRPSPYRTRGSCAR